MPTRGPAVERHLRQAEKEAWGEMKEVEQEGSGASTEGGVNPGASEGLGRGS